MRGYFVTGTGTEVGKTVVAAVLARSLATTGERVAVFKPAVSGLDAYGPGGIPPDHVLLRMAADSTQADDEIAPYRYGPAVSPHLGAELAGQSIEPQRLREAVNHAAAGADVLVCEGVGGFLVPLASDYLVRDFASDLGLPVIVAASPSLGTINHTLLTVEAVRRANLEVAAVVFTPWAADTGTVERSNRATVERLASVRTAVLPRLDLAAPQSWPDLGLA